MRGRSGFRSRAGLRKLGLILVDDASTDSETLEALPRLAALDSRIQLVRRKENGGISVASNDALALAKGEWIGFLDHDDLLEPDALFEMRDCSNTIPMPI